MRNFACPFVAVCISAAIVQTKELPNGQLPSTSEKQHVSKQGTQNPEAYALYLKGRSYLDIWTNKPFRTLKPQSPILIKPSPKTPATHRHIQGWPASMRSGLTMVTVPSKTTGRRWPSPARHWS